MPTRLGWGFLLLVGGIAFAAINTGNNLLYLLVGICLAALILSFVSAGRSLSRLAVELTFPEEILARDPTAFVLTLRNRNAGSPAPPVRARLRAGLSRTGWADLPPLAPGGSGTRFLPIRFERRGLYRAERIDLETTHPFGLVRRRRSAGSAGEFFVYPSPVSPGGDRAFPPHGRGEAPARRVGEGLELRQIRDYQFDDDSRHIDWRATARVGRLMIKEFLEEGSERLILVFDPAVGRLDEGTRRRFEERVSLATGLVLRCGDRRTPFRFLAPDYEFKNVDPPGGHRPVLEYLAAVQPRLAPDAPPFAREMDALPGTVRLSAGAPGT